MASSFPSIVRIVALVVLLRVTSYCSALSLPLNVSSTLTSSNPTSLSESRGPKYLPIAEAPGFQIRFNGYGNPLRPSDCVDALVIAQEWLLGEAHQDPGHSMDLKATRTFIIDSMKLTLRVKNGLTYESAALFVAGMMEWGNEYGFSEVEEVLFINPWSSPLALAELEASGSVMAVTQANQTTETSSLSRVDATDPFHDPFLYPIATVPGFYIRFMTYNVPLPRHDCLSALETADAALLAAYQQKVPLLNKSRTWSSGKASFTLTPASELTLIDATLFVLGTMQLGSEKGFVEARAIFLRTDPNLKGQLKFYGTGRLTGVRMALL